MAGEVARESLDLKTRAFLALVDVVCFVGHALVLCLCWMLVPFVHVYFWLKGD